MAVRPRSAAWSAKSKFCYARMVKLGPMFAICLAMAGSQAIAAPSFDDAYAQAEKAVRREFSSRAEITGAALNSIDGEVIVCGYASKRSGRTSTPIAAFIWRDGRLTTTRWGGRSHAVFDREAAATCGPDWVPPRRYDWRVE